MLNATVKLNYVLMVANHHFTSFLLDVPDRPEDLEVTAITKDYISVTWKPPKYDGGSEVISYILEARMIGKDKFVRLTKETLMDRKYTYDGLREGDTFEFRVSAVNEVGPGKPSFSTKPITCKDELGECFFSSSNCSSFGTPHYTII